MSSCTPKRRWGNKTILYACGAALAAAAASPVFGGTTSAKPSSKPAVIEQHVVDAAMEKLQQRQRERAATAPSTAPATQPAAWTQDWSTSLSDPYGVQSVTARKLEMLRAYDARIAEARFALRRHVLSARDVRRLVEERAALLQLPLEKLRALMIEADHHNAQRLERFRDAFGELASAGKTVSVILMKSGQIDFATPLPEDPLTVEIETARGVRRTYFQFYISPKDSAPRRYNGYVEFVYDSASRLWIPTWTDFNGQPLPLFDAEAFVPLRPYDVLYNGTTFVVAQAHAIRPPELFTLLTPRWTVETGTMYAPRERR